MDYSCIVFDTAPTGHTLRLLNFPTILEKGLAKLVSLKNSMGGMMSQVGQGFSGGLGSTASFPTADLFCVPHCSTIVKWRHWR